MFSFVFNVFFGFLKDAKRITILLISSSVPGRTTAGAFASAG